MATNRYHIRSEHGHYVEADNKEILVYLRSINPMFKGRHVQRSLQCWDDIIKLCIIYPPECRSRSDFYNYNEELGLND